MVSRVFFCSSLDNSCAHPTDSFEWRALEYYPHFSIILHLYAAIDTDGQVDLELRRQEKKRVRLQVYSNPRTVTVTVTVVVRETVPFQAVIVTMYVPGVVRSDADTVNVAAFVPLG